ncbi:hypothetical protein [Micromonospora ureilytica]|uniref:Pentapeptide repeat-containing protein n=1 Tax=Micromonospora ureilytica TaxID=709868 RepID=A0ABS0JE28_9ACTN|nr:hypothetical protein [Micromonospora ureilytica]MBG6065320.1 hypothetical protein [Micromonospora ureilytica]
MADVSKEPPRQGAAKWINGIAREIAEVSRPDSHTSLWRILPVAAGASIILVITLIVLLWIVVAILSGLNAPDPQAVSRLLTAAISMTALIGASLGAVYAFRKQLLAEREGVRAEQQVYSERFVKAAELLAHERPSARLAGLHSLTSLADDWRQGRQSCASAIASYLRLPPPDDAGEREVRRTAWKSVHDRLMDPSATNSWHREELDFSGGTYQFVDLDSAMLHNTRVLFRDCIFKDGELRLTGVGLVGGRIDFTGSSFVNMKIFMVGMRLEDNSHIYLDDTKITDSDFYPVAVNIAGGSSMRVRSAEVHDSNFKFDADDLMSYMFQGRDSVIAGEVDFSESKLTNVSIRMHAYTLAAGRLFFSGAVTDNFRLSPPGTMEGHVYVNLDVKAMGPTEIRIGPGQIDGGDLRIRPLEGVPATLDVDFVNYQVLGGEVMVQTRQNVWKSFRFDHIGEIVGNLNFNLSFPPGVEVDVDLDPEDMYSARRARRRQQARREVGPPAGDDGGAVGTSGAAAVE